MWLVWLALCRTLCGLWDLACRIYLDRAFCQACLQAVAERNKQLGRRVASTDSELLVRKDGCPRVKLHEVDVLDEGKYLPQMLCDDRLGLERNGASRAVDRDYGLGVVVDAACPPQR